jgi:hypothetical protein
MFIYLHSRPAVSCLSPANGNSSARVSIRTGKLQIGFPEATVWGDHARTVTSSAMAVQPELNALLLLIKGALIRPNGLEPHLLGRERLTTR